MWTSWLARGGSGRRWGPNSISPVKLWGRVKEKWNFRVCFFLSLSSLFFSFFPWKPDFICVFNYGTGGRRHSSAEKCGQIKSESSPPPRPRHFRWKVERLRMIKHALLAYRIVAVRNKIVNNWLWWRINFPKTMTTTGHYFPQVRESDASMKRLRSGSLQDTSSIFLHPE